MTTTARPTTLYNPHLLSKDELIAGFIARQPLLDELVDDLRRGGGQHHLLIGSRGTGKTTLLLRLGLAIDDDAALAKRAIALRFPEEQYNIIRPSDFWLNCLDALVDALERRGGTDEAKRLDALIQETDDLDDEDTRAERALGHLTAWARRAKKLVVLLIDNLDLVFDRLSESHWALRKVLSGDKHLVLVGASSSAVPETFEYGQAFYDFFNVHELGGLDDDEARRVLVRLSEVRGTPQVTKAIADHPGRLKSLLLLCGGTPRTLQLLHGVLAQGPDESAERDLERMVDQATPSYQARFEGLPAQAQQIVDAVALHWHPMTAIECADETRLDVTIVSAQLTRFVRQGVIAKVLHESGKLGFQIAERFFGIWYLMRTGRRHRRLLAWLAACVQEQYGHEDARSVHAGERSLRWNGRDVSVATSDAASWRHPSGWYATIRGGRAHEAAESLRASGMHERALPLYEALLAFADGKTGDLIHLAPEVRIPAEHYLAAFHAASPPATSPSPAPPPPSRPRSARRATARPGTPAPRRPTKRRP